MLVSTTALSTIPTMVAPMVATILTTFTASNQTAQCQRSFILGLSESLLPLLMLIWKLEVTFVHSQTKLEPALAALKNPPLLRSALVPCRILYAAEDVR